MQPTPQKSKFWSFDKSSLSLPRPVGVKLRHIAISFSSSNTSILLKPVTIEPGMKYLIYGRSGLGKTTILHMMAGLLPPDKGNVYLGKQDLYKPKEWQRSRIRRNDIGVIFQTLNLLEHLSALENVFLALDATVSSKAQATTTLDAVGLKDYQNVLVSELSLGQRQRVAVARILAQKPALILADEPTSSLDDDHASVVMEALLKAAGEATLVMVSHDRRFRDSFDRCIDIEEVLLG